MSKILAHFDVLTKHGLRVIPLRPYSKIPVQKNWADWNYENCRYILEKNPESNIGLLLGEVMDVEGDSVEANERINDLVRDYPHPMYTSTKSVHHLFINPEPTLTILKHQQIEFRANRHQSVLPPSVLDTGVEYKWVDGKLTLPIPPMPDRLLTFFRKLQKVRKTAIKPGHMKLPCFKCREKCFIHRKRYDLELIAFKKLGLRWMCHDCREVDLRQECRDIRKNKKEGSQTPARLAS